MGLGVLVLGVGISAPVRAQTYVAGAIGADVSRVSHTDSSLISSPGNGAEVLSGALRVGTSVGSNWGVELEFARSGRSNEEGPIIGPLVETGVPTNIAQLLPTGLVPGNIPIPFSFDYRLEVRRRQTSVDAVAWARQSAGGSVDLVYLGGIAFARDRSDVTESINVSPGPLSQAIRAFVPQSFSSSSIEYAARPLVGMEARIQLTSRLRLIPGLRVQGLGDGWLLRPHVGLGWFF